VLSDVASVLAAAGLGVYDPVGITSSIFIHRRPDAPASLLSVELYGSAPPGPYLFDATLPVYENPRLQIVSRDADGDTAYTRCYNAWQALVGLSDVSLGGVHYFSIRSVTGPVSQGVDENNLFLYGCNIQAMRTIG
jgi:hypothetical protein